MELTTRGRYAVMAMADLARQALDAEDLDTAAHDKADHEAADHGAEAHDMAARRIANGRGVGKADCVPLSLIAERQQLSIAYLEQIFSKLRRAGLVASERGRAGGYRLGRSANQIMVVEIMAAVEEETRMTRCQGGHGGCVGETRCLTHGLWDALGSHIHQFLGRISLADVIAGQMPGDAAREHAATDAAGAAAGAAGAPSPAPLPSLAAPIPPAVGSHGPLS